MTVEIERRKEMGGVLYLKSGRTRMKEVKDEQGETRQTFWRPLHGPIVQMEGPITISDSDDDEEAGCSTNRGKI